MAMMKKSIDWQKNALCALCNSCWFARLVFGLLRGREVLKSVFLLSGYLIYANNLGAWKYLVEIYRWIRNKKV